MWKRLSDFPSNVVNHQTIMINNSIYVIGGYKNSKILNDEKITVYIIAKYNVRLQLRKCFTFEWNCRNDNFIKLIPESVEPIDCFGHTMVKWRQLGVLFGGCRSPGQFGYSSNKIYLFVRSYQCLPVSLGLLGDTSLKHYWIIVNEIGGSIPPERDGHSAVVWHDYMFLFGGLLGGEARYFDNKLYQMDFKSWQWTIICKGDYLEPLGRDFCTLVTYENSIYMFGGRSDNAIHDVTYRDIYDSAVWEYRLGPSTSNKWSKIQPGYGVICDSVWEQSQNDDLNGHGYLNRVSECPFPRRSHMAVVFGKEIIMFGGLYETDSFNVHFNDLWSFNIETRHWKQLSTVSKQASIITEPPNLRRGSLTVINDNCALLIGGVTISSGESSLPEGDICVKSLMISANILTHQNIHRVNDLTGQMLNIFYNKLRISLSGLLTIINELSLKSIKHIYLLQPRLSLYQRALSVVTNTYSFNQLKEFPVPPKVMSDIEDTLLY